MSKITEKIRAAVLSKNFLPVIFGFFIIQALVYATIIGFNIPSDEQYHFSSIQYYAEQPVVNGPFTSDQNPETIKDVRAIDRNPSYLFHYLLSFPVRLFNALHLSQHTQVLLLRYINILFAAASLYLVKKIFDRLSRDKLLKNLALAFFTLTGAVVWLAASINYDNLANLLWTSFVLLGLRFIRSPDLTKLLVMIILVLLTPITKATFLPFIAVGFAVVLLIAALKRKQKNLSLLKLKIKWNYKLILLAGFTVLAGFLFVERIGVNLAAYQAVSPKCQQFFSLQQCATNNVYNRNIAQALRYSEEDKRQLIKHWDPFSHTGLWIYKMYNSLPWHLGHKRIESNNYSEVAAWLLGGLALMTALFSRRKFSFSRGYIFVLFLTALYLSGVFLYNLNTYFSVGQMYAYQGRYLLPVLPFVFLFVATLALNSYRNMNPAAKKLFALLWLIILPAYIVSHFTPLVFTVGGDSSWFSEYVIETTP